MLSKNDKDASLLQGIRDVLASTAMYLSACEITELLRSRRYSYDPGMCAPKNLRAKVTECLENNNCFRTAGEYGMGYTITERKKQDEAVTPKWGQLPNLCSSDGAGR